MEHTRNTSRMWVGTWSIKSYEDEDGHLNVHIHNEDCSQVLFFDSGDDGLGVIDRYTTEGIEESQRAKARSK